jgi:hypothetical protein
MGNVFSHLHVKMALTLDERVPEFSDTLYIANIYKELFGQVIILLYYSNSPILALFGCNCFKKCTVNTTQLNE